MSHPAERDTLLLTRFKPTRRIVAVVILALTLAIAAVPAFAHPGDHEHCEQTITGTHKCH